MLHFECLEDFPFPLQGQDRNSGLVQFSLPPPRTSIVSKGREYVLHLQDCPFAIDLVNKALLVELNPHLLQEARQHSCLVCPLHEEANGTDTVSLFGPLKPVVHESCQVDIVC